MTHRVGFRVPAEPGRVLCGIALLPEAGHNWAPVDPSEVEPVTVEVSSREPVFAADDALATAIQCESAGMHALATAIAREVPSLFVSRPGGRLLTRQFKLSVVFGPPDLSHKGRVAYLAWAYWCNALVEPNCNRMDAARRMEALMASEPALRADEEKQRLLESLKAALRPSIAQPGSVEAQIDHLVEISGEPGGGQQIMDGDRRYADLAMSGFSAMPELLEHMTDSRLTRALIGGSRRIAIPRHLRVGDLISSIIANLAGEELPQGWLDTSNEFSSERIEAAKRWWAGASKQGEEAYFMSHVLPPQHGDQPRLPLRLMLTILAKRYASNLPKVFRDITAAAEQSSTGPAYTWLAAAPYQDVPSIVTASALPHAQVVEVLLWGSEQPVGVIASASATQLKRFDPKDVTEVKASLGGRGR